MAGRLILLLLVGSLVLAGCYQTGPNDPSMTPEESADLRRDSYTPEQAQARSQRPR